MSTRYSFTHKGWDFSDDLKEFVWSVFLHSGFLVGPNSRPSGVLLNSQPLQSYFGLYRQFTITKSKNWFNYVLHHLENKQNNRFNAETKNQASNCQKKNSFGSSLQSYSLWVTLYIMKHHMFVNKTVYCNLWEKYKQCNWVFGTNGNLLIHISFQLDVVNI